MTETRSVLVVLTVPEDWPELPVGEIERKLRDNEPHMTRHLAREVKRWGQVDEVDVEGLQGVVDDLRADHDPQEEADDGG